MKKYLTQTAFYLLLLAGLVALYILVIYFRPDLVDNFYYRFTTPKSNSLILGGSRAAQGIRPDVINQRLCDEEHAIINHSFALGPSSIGPNYLREIKQKIKRESVSGLFIISLTPWTLTTEPENITDDSTQFYEVVNQLFVGNLKSSNQNPNVEYLQNHWHDKFTVFENAFKQLVNYHGLIELHPNGWLEVSISMEPDELTSRIERSTNEYKENKSILSNTRFLYLEKIIVLLQKYGDVYFVRLPVSAGMAQIENDKFPEFDTRIEQVAQKYGIDYINFINLSGQFQTTDTHHLWKEESDEITNLLCDSIEACMNRSAYIEYIQ